MALETAELEKRAKEHQYQDKTKTLSLSLVWKCKVDNYQPNIPMIGILLKISLGEKHASIVELFPTGRDYGNTFLYNILNLLREAENDSINLAA